MIRSGQSITGEESYDDKAQLKTFTLNSTGRKEYFYQIKLWQVKRWLYYYISISKIAFPNTMKLSQSLQFTKRLSVQGLLEYTGTYATTISIFTYFDLYNILSPTSVKKVSDGF